MTATADHPPPEVPPSQHFVWTKYDLRALSLELQRRFGPREVRTTLQCRLRDLGPDSAEGMDQADIAHLYRLSPDACERLLSLVESQARSQGVELEYSDDISRSTGRVPLDNGYEETAQTDGQALWIHCDGSRTDTLGRIEIIAHFALGHFLQWSGDDPSLMLDPEEAWTIGWPDPCGLHPRVKSLWGLYEVEALMLTVEGLRRALRGLDISPDQRERLLQNFTDSAFANLDFIEAYIRGLRGSFNAAWRFGRPIPAPRHYPSVNPIKRHSLELGLTRSRD